MQFDKTVINLNIKSLPDLVPTSKHGVVGKWWFTTDNHFAATFLNDVGETTENRIRQTSVPG
jgi:hypothetical protein